MSTDYRVQLTASDGSQATLTIIDSAIPFQDSWKPDDESQWGSNGGAVSSWGSGGAYLTGPAGVQSIFLDGFGQDTEENQSGSGQKNYDDGSFPLGTFTWRCVSKE